MSLISHAATVLPRLINEKLFAAMNEILRKEQFGFSHGIETKDAIRLLRTLAELYIRKGNKVIKHILSI